MKKTFYFLSILSLIVCQPKLNHGQAISLTDVTANPGQQILMPVNFASLTNVGAITLFITYDESVLTFTGLTNLIPEAAGTLANAMTGPTRVGISWVAASQGVNFPDGKAFDIQFSYIQGACNLSFTTACEVVDWDGYPINITYVNGSITSTGITLDLKVFLNGPYDPSTNAMNNGVLTSYIPLSQPFNPPLPYYGNNAPGWLYTGTESVSSIPASVTDWILLEIRDAANGSAATSATTLAKKALFLKNDGSIADLDGVSDPVFNVTISQGLFVVIWHRNHLAVMNANPIPQAGGIYLYDFSTAALQAFGGANGHKQLEPGVWGMIGGDGNADKQINNSDKVDVWKVNSGQSGYLGGDFSVNGQCNNQDKVDVWKLNSGLGSQVPY